MSLEGTSIDPYGEIERLQSELADCEVDRDRYAREANKLEAALVAANERAKLAEDTRDDLVDDCRELTSKLKAANERAESGRRPMSAPCLCGHAIISHRTEHGADESSCECCSCDWYEPTYNARVFAADPSTPQEPKPPTDEGK